MKILALFVLLISTQIFAHPAGQKASDGTFKLSQKSLDHLGVNFEELKKQGPWSLPLESIVRIKFSQGVYRRYEGELTFVLVEVLKKTDTHVLVSSEDLEVGDEVAISGAKFLRMTENDLNSETVDTCSH